MRSTDTFFRDRGIDPRFASNVHHAGATVLIKLQEEYVRGTWNAGERLMQDPTRSLAVRALDHVTAYAAAAICVSVTSTVGGEMIARTVVESSINLLSILQGDRAKRLYAYFSTHIAAEEDQNKKWRDALRDLTGEDRSVHEFALRQKETALAHYKAVSARAFAESGVDIANRPQWEGVFSRFDAVARAIRERTVNASLFSQTQADAQALLDELSERLARKGELTRPMDAEITALSWLGVALAINEYSHAVACYLAAFDMVHPGSEIKRLCADADQLVADAEARLPPV